MKFVIILWGGGGQSLLRRKHTLLDSMQINPCNGSKACYMYINMTVTMVELSCNHSATFNPNVTGNF